MRFGGYRLIAQIGAGRDGIAYRALDPDGQTPVEIRDLTTARADADRWPKLVRRLRLSFQLEHPRALRVLEQKLDDSPPFIALEWVEGRTLANGLGAVLPLKPAEALAMTHVLAGAVASAHRIGLEHGSIGPDRVRLGDDGLPRLDFTGLDTMPPVGAPDSGLEPDRARDVYNLGLLLGWLLTGSLAPVSAIHAQEFLPGAPGLLLRAMLASDPGERPTAREVEDSLTVSLSAGDLAGPKPAPISSSNEMLTCSVPAMPLSSSAVMASGMRLGRYRLRDVLGTGGQGVVYRAEDSADGSIVAVKVLRPEWASRPEAARRFGKEARLMAKLNNPHVVNLLDYNDEGGIAYLVMEFVTGKNLSDLLTEQGPLDEPTALAIATDVARALEDAHDRGIVHRDVKPANILLPYAFDDSSTHPSSRVKLSDFGLARNIVDSESLAMTAPGAVLGTPHYMAPEQSTGRAVDPRTDVYALGATLFHMLAGRPPFQAQTREELHVMHGGTPPPPLAGLNAKLSDGVCRLVDRALAKSPDDRYPDAGALRRDLERLARGEPTGIPLHPVLPPCDPRKVMAFEFRWELESSPRQLWPHVTNTDRLDHAVGFAPVRYTYQPDPARGVRQFAEGVKAGMAEAWEEHPYEWVEPRRMGVLREYSQGPFCWLVSTVELTPRPSGGTLLVHRLRLEPRGWKSRTFSSLGVGVRFRAALGRVYERIDATLAGKLGPALTLDPFEPPPELTDAQRERLEHRLDALAALGVDATAVECLGDLLSRASAQELARLRPLALARRWGLEPEAVLTVCLNAAREGLLVLLWDILCPACRLSCEVLDTLRAIREHGHCEACQVDFSLDFARSVELMFRAHPEIREAETRLYCAGGPAHAPHVLAQVRVAPGERFELEMNLPKGAYRLRGPQLPWSNRFQVQPDATTRHFELDLAQVQSREASRVVGTGSQVLILENSGEHELLARVERETERDDALTAIQALAFASFRDLYPGEVLSPGQLVSVTSVTLLVTGLESPDAIYERLGEARAFAVIHQHFRLLDEAVRSAGGTLVKTVDEGIVAAFRNPEEAVTLGLAFQGVLLGDESTRDLRLGVVVHRGAALAATLDGRLDYFGPVVRRARQLLRYARGGELVLTAEVAGDPSAAAILLDRGFAVEALDTRSDGLFHRVTTLGSAFDRARCGSKARGSRSANRSPCETPGRPNDPGSSRPGRHGRAAPEARRGGHRRGSGEG